MGRISDLIPAIYYDEKNDLIRFTNCLDDEVKLLEQKVKEITELINIDKCPDDKLPYLAALVNCPLMGTDAILWRRQIKNWPYLLKIKGTALSLDVFLYSINVDAHKIYTFFRDANGNLITEKPDGAPFKKDDIWYNIRTHYFDLELFYEAGHYLDWTTWQDELLYNMDIWLTHAKPFHSELRKLDIIVKRDEKICLLLGSIVNQGIHTEIDYKFSDKAEATHTLNFASIVNQGKYTNINAHLNSKTKENLSLVCNSIIAAGVYHEIN